MSRWKFFLLALLAQLSLELRGFAQCNLNDNLDGPPCCAFAQANLPSFKNFTQVARSICWRDCGIDATTNVIGKWFNVTVSPGTMVPCGERLMRLDIVNGLNVLLWRGQMRLQYSRTWLATDSQGFPVQVWRFLVNGDLRAFPPAGAPPCPVPPCASAHNGRALYTGYVDFVENCAIAGGAFQYAWMLTHACDAIDHHAGFARAGVFHPDRSYSFVAPSLGFVPGPIQPTEGTPFSTFDAVRSRVLTPAPVTAICTVKEPSSHQLTPQQLLCFCGLPGSNQFMTGDVRINGSCGTSIANPPGNPLLPGFVSMGLGSWTNPNVYPGVQALRWNVAGYDYFDSCTGSVQHEVFYGVTTLGGYPALQLVGGIPGAALPPTFIDQASAQLANGATTMNVPFSSLHFVELNH